jgi:hypothetical protein
LNPFFSVGLVTAVVPIFIHLISKKRGVKKSFPALRFLRASDGKVARRSRIKDLILLFLRTLILVLLVFVFSKPAVFSFSTLGVREVKSVAIVVDNSFSMGYGDNFTKAKSRAEKLIESLPDGSFGAVFPLIPTDDTISQITQDRRRIIKDLNNLKLSYTFADNERRLEEIYNFILSAPNQKKELIFFTDLQRNGWMGDEFRREWLMPVDMASGLEENRAVSGLDFKDEGDSLRISAKVSNYSTNSIKDLLITVFLGDKEVKGFLNIEGGNQQIKDIIVPKVILPQGEILGKVEISHDNLDLDDVRYFVIPQNKKPRVLIVDGDPREDARLSKSYYLARAVETISEILPLNLTIKDNDSFLDEKLKEYNLIFLANVGDIAPQKAHEIEEFLKNGGVIVVFLGDRVRGDLYNAIFREILPSEVGTISDGDYSLSVRELNKFTEGINEKFDQVKVKKLFNLRLAKDPSIILDASSNSPFFIQGKVEKGSIFLFASTADTAWSNFPLTTVFLPIIKKIFDLSFSAESQRRNFIVGEAVEIGFPDGVDQLKIRIPLGEELKVYKEDPKFRKTLTPGIYTVKEDENASYNFSVNIDPKESNLERISLKTVAPLYHAESGLTKIFKEIWNYFLWGVIALFISESVLRVFM